MARGLGLEGRTPDGSLSRPALSRIVFADAARRKALEAIVHPAVREEMWRQAQQYRAAGRPAVVLDVPLLIESQLHRTVDRVWVVYIDKESQLARLVARDGLTPEQAAHG